MIPDTLDDVAREWQVPIDVLRQALRESHPEASPWEVQQRAWRLMECGWSRNGGTCDKPKGHAGRHRYFRQAY